MNLDVSTLNFAKHNCKYYIIFAPKYRIQMICGKIKVERLK